MDVLCGLLERFGHEVPLAATLHCITVERPRSTINVVEVRVEDQRIGILSPFTPATSRHWFAMSLSEAGYRSRELFCGATQ